MIIRDRMDVLVLPKGSLSLEKDGTRLEAQQDDDFATAAAQVLIDHGIRKNYESQAEVVADAINDHHWGLGARNYIAVVYYGGGRLKQVE